MSIMKNDKLIKIMFIGDIVGRPGRNAVTHFLPMLREKYGLDFVIANGENLSSGKGMTYEKYREMSAAGIDYFTSGNHIWKNSDIIPYLKENKVRVLRPANYPAGCPGNGYVDIEIKGVKFTLANIMGQAFIPIFLENPFKIINEIVENTKDSILLVDFHAEATSEKVAMGFYLDGRAGALVGTHTHIQTSDERVLPGGTAYITDLGMCGPQDSVLGVKKEIIIKQFLTALPQSHKVAVGASIFNAAIVTINPVTKKAVEILRVNELFDN
jgi:hypothetical protein